jgi:hypothetical protein
VRWQPDRLDRTIAYVHAEAGPRVDSIELNALVQTVVLTPERQAAAATVADRIDGLSPADALTTPFLAIGTHDEIAAHLLECRRRWGISYFSVRDVDGFAPVIDRIRQLEPIGPAAERD